MSVVVPNNSQPALELALPKLAARFILNFNHHKTHHRNPAVPWHGLPRAHVSENEGYDVPLATAVVAQFKGPIPTDAKTDAKIIKAPPYEGGVGEGGALPAGMARS